MRAALLLLFFCVIAITTVAGGKNKERNKPSGPGAKCKWSYSSCVASNGDCGAGFRDGTCDTQTKKMKCRVPCNWKKQFGADCKYRYGSWGECDLDSGSRSTTATLKKAMFNVECQQTLTVTKPCSGEKIQKQEKKEKRRKIKEEKRASKIKAKIEAQ
ncbi:midkine-like [Cynoglossus semilaevis]|uniref:Midkine n=1 Tax=Cynoglossus semilaevis TaxID=244447 RepID=A0A3P8V493_CYNSE|nr:midkine-like [Cynoglossus semilaevis]